MDAVDRPKHRPISIHSPHARGDLRPRAAYPDSGISIHSPHARGDRRGKGGKPPRNNFNPLPSCEGRQKHTQKGYTLSVFQSTPLMRGETSMPQTLPAHPPISIHSPHARGDATGLALLPLQNNFNPLPSCEGRRVRVLLDAAGFAFQSTPLMRGETAPLSRRS